MTSDEFKAARQRLGLTQAELGRIIDTDPSTIRRWEMPPGRSTARPPNPVAARVLLWMLGEGRPAEWPEHGDAPGH